jgi:hypothetical protein
LCIEDENSKIKKVGGLKADKLLVALENDSQLLRERLEGIMEN